MVSLLLADSILCVRLHALPGTGSAGPQRLLNLAQQFRCLSIRGMQRPGVDRGRLEGQPVGFAVSTMNEPNGLPRQLLQTIRALPWRC
jgi:hypothetical protein